MRKTKNNSRIIPSGPFRGKKIEFAPTTGIDKFRASSEDFMNKIFAFKPGEYLVSDESSLYDFTGLEERELRDIELIKGSKKHTISMFRTLSREIYLRSLKELEIARVEHHADRIHRTTTST